MPRHQYNAGQALDLILKRLESKDTRLAAHVRFAIDAGKDVEETEPALDRRRRERTYRKTVPFTHEEALHVALDALQAYFVEQPLFVAAAADSFAKAAIGVPPRRRRFNDTNADESEPVTLEAQGMEKAVEIEIQTETQLSRIGEETISLKRIPNEQIEEQRHHIARIRSLTKCTEE